MLSFEKVDLGESNYICKNNSITIKFALFILFALNPRYFLVIGIFQPS